MLFVYPLGLATGQTGLGLGRAVQTSFNFGGGGLGAGGLGGLRSGLGGVVYK